MKTVFALLIGIVIGSVGAALASAGSVSEEVRVAVRSAGGGFVEVGISQRATDGDWGEVVAPAEARLDARSTAWQFSGGVEVVRSSAAAGAIRFRVTPEAIFASPEAGLVETPCRQAAVTRRSGSETVWLHALEPGECAGWAPPLRMLSVRDGTVEIGPDDPQAGRVRDWLYQVRAEVAARWGDEPASLRAFEGAVALAYRDFFGDQRTPPRVVHDPASPIQLHDFGTNEIVTPRSELSALSVLDSIAYQLTGRLDSDDRQLEFEWSGPELAAQAIAVFERYLPGFDAAAARISAAEFGVRVAASPPLQAPRQAGAIAEQLRGLLGLALPLMPSTDSEQVSSDQASAGFSVVPEDGRLVVRSEFGTVASECNNVGVLRGNRTVWVRPWSTGDCSDSEHLFPVGFVQDASIEVDRQDPQQYRVYDWERQVEANLLPAELDEAITLERAQAIANAVFADVFGPSRRPPRVRVVDEAQSYYSHQFRQIRLSEAGLDVPTVLHETVHAALAVQQTNTFARWAGHGPQYANTILMLWQRYIPGFDLRRALEAAVLHGVDIASRSPLSPVGGDAGAAAVTAALALDLALDLPDATEPEDCTYIVQAGDTATEIALQHGLTLTQLLLSNPWLDVAALWVGQEIVVRCP